MESMLSLDDFFYPLPETRIAQEPNAERDSSRLLLRRADGVIEDRYIRDITALLPAGAVVVMNNSRVIPGRLFGHLASGGKVEVFLLSPVPNTEGKGSTWQCLGRPMKKLKEGTPIHFPGGLVGTTTALVGRDTQQPSLHLHFDLAPDAFEAWLWQHGYIPLPPYIHRAAPLPYGQSADRERYQTVYAEKAGSVAAPTAGLHFSPELLQSMRTHGIELCHVTLHVGGGTFLPVKTQDIAQHVMHHETYMVTESTVATIEKARREGRPVVAVGTTTLRCLESFWRVRARQGMTAGQWLSTDLFIYPRHAGERIRPQCIDALLTNFHQPGSTLLMLVAALVGYDATMAAYQHALGKDYYRFLSYGDACLFWLSP